MSSENPSLPCVSMIGLKASWESNRQGLLPLRLFVKVCREVLMLLRVYLRNHMAGQSRQYLKREGSALTN